MESSPTLQVLRYHEETKHHPARPARSLGYLDWATQPNPFRSYEGVTPLLLPLLKRDPEGGHLDLYERTRNLTWDITVESVGAFLELSLGLSAWKSIPEGNKWALRMNPSSGNLHPTEAHLILPPLERSTRSQRAGLEVPSLGDAAQGGLYHYNSYLHALEPRALAGEDLWARLRGYFGAGFFCAFTSIYWREAWKYGERALRYCHHDLGHALAGASCAANLLGWRVTCLNGLSQREARALLGFDQVRWPTDEAEDPDLVCFVSPSGQKAIPRTLPANLLKAVSLLSFQGQPNRLSTDHAEWPLINETAEALSKPALPEASIRFPKAPELLRTPAASLSGAQLIRQRRSAVAFDGVTSMSRERFIAMLDKTLPRNGLAPFDAELADPAVDLAIFVHRVTGLDPGLYWLLRQPARLTDLKRGLRRTFEWSPVDGPLPLFKLASGDLRETAARISCLQSIGGDSAFSLGMIAQFRPGIDKEPWRYPQFYWECGMIGQVLYLEAEAHGLRGTGIGCFFDDLMHQQLGLTGNHYQSLYHFTVGRPVEDHRLVTAPPYAHLPRDRM